MTSPESGHQPSPAEAAWEAHYARIYPEGVFSDPYMKSDGRPAFIAAKKAGFVCGWEEATEATSDMPSFEHMATVASLSALRKAARAVLNESSPWTAAYRALAALL